MKTIMSVSMLVILTATVIVACGRGQQQPTTPTPPTVITSDATGIAVTSARLHGNLDDLGTAPNVNVYFVWGVTAGGPYANETSPQLIEKRGAFSFDLTELDPGIIYYFQSKAVGDGTGYGIEKSFTTLTMPPVVTTNDATSVAVDIVRLNGTLDDLGTALSVNVTFVWGITSGGPYPNETALELMDTGKAYSFDLVGLTPGTYYFQAKAVGDGVNYGVEKGFTIPVTFPDSNLEVAIREAINKPEGAIYLSDLQSLTDLVAPQKGIANISGLEYCSNLQGLVLTDNNVSDISPLAGLISLKWLDLVHNDISDISPLTGLTSLDWLPLGGNSISDISPLVMNSGLSEGDFVHLGGNPLSDESINVYIPRLLERGVDVQR